MNYIHKDTMHSVTCTCGLEKIQCFMLQGLFSFHRLYNLVNDEINALGLVSFAAAETLARSLESEKETHYVPAFSLGAITFNACRNKSTCQYA